MQKDLQWPRSAVIEMCVVLTADEGHDLRWQ